MARKTTDDNASDSINPTHADLHAASIKKTLGRIRRHLGPREQRMSRFIHGRAADTVLSLIGGTVARPSGILGGGLISFTGSVALLIFIRHYGYTYNLRVPLVLFLVGFCVGVLVELGIRLVRTRQ